MLNESLFAAPSSRKLFDWLRWPFTLKPPVTLPKPPGVAFPSCPPSDVGGATTPGISVPSCVKLRPLSGRSTTFCRSITTPSVAFVVSTSGDCASTISPSENCPICSVTSARTVSLTATVTFSRTVVRKPASAAFTP